MCTGSCHSRRRSRRPCPCSSPGMHGRSTYRDGSGHSYWTCRGRSDRSWSASSSDRCCGDRSSSGGSDGSCSAGGSDRCCGGGGDSSGDWACFSGHGFSRFKASSRLIGSEMLKSSISWFNWVGWTSVVSSATMSDKAGIQGWWCPGWAYVCWSTVSGYPFGLITQCVVCPLFAGIDVHVLVAARFRTAGT